MLFIRFLFVTLAVGSADSPNLTPSHANMIAILRANTNIALKPLVALANEEVKKTGLMVTVTLDQKKALSPNDKFYAELSAGRIQDNRTTCGTFEIPVGIRDLETKPSEDLSHVIWNGAFYTKFEKYQPYHIDPDTSTAYFAYVFRPSEPLPGNRIWWDEVLAREPSLKEEAPFLLIASSASGFRFSDSFEAYRASKHREVKGTREELKRMPFGRVFLYEKENQRIQVPESCL